MNTSSILPFVNKPGRYLGKEFNTITKGHENIAVSFALVFPDLYEIGMSHLGLQILYHIINDRDDLLAERSYCPDIDAEQVLLSQQQELFTLESKRPLNQFDVLGFTLPYELCYTNIITVLKLARIPLYQKDRTDADPLVLGGGSCSLNPEPVADFFDAILLGDGEEGIIDFALVLKECKKQGLSRAETLNRLAAIDGIYIPSHVSVSYSDNGAISAITDKDGNAAFIGKRIVSDLEATSHLFHPIVPNAKTVHDRLGLEIARGCTRGCRFCQAGIIYRPVRERSVDQIMEMAEQGISNSGFEEMALLSLSTGDYSCINELLPRIMNRYAEHFVSVSMPSMRVGTLSQKVMDQIKRVRKTGFTVAPEAGSERMRQVINKGITEEDLLTTCHDAFTLGWSAIKLYFMIGLPTEEEADIVAIGELAAKTLETAKGIPGRGKQVTVSVGTFVPKPHTPFQWEPQLSLEESRARIALLRASMPRKGAKLKYHDPETSFLEGVFSRGDRRLSRVIEAAWERGARLDSWSDHFSLPRWQEAAAACGIELDDYLHSRPLEGLLPWSHLDCGVSTDFLRSELEKSKDGTYTPDCRYNGCQQCGLCDFKTVQPQVKNPELHDETSQATSPSPRSKVSDRHFKYMVRYMRHGDICYLGHLEILQLLFRAVRRADITTHFSQGFNPTPKISFGGALPVGMESDDEYLIMDLPNPLDSIERTKTRFNNALPDGLSVTAIALHSGRIPQRVLTTYTIFMGRSLRETEQESIRRYQKSSSFPVSRIRKGKKKEIDIRPLLEIATSGDDELHITLKSAAGEPGVKVQEALVSILCLQENEVAAWTIRKISWKALDDRDPA